MRSFDELRDQVVQFHKDRPSMDEYNKRPAVIEMALVLESAEVLELAKFGLDETEKYASELSDVLIYLIILADNKGVDLFQATIDKVELNKVRMEIKNFQGGGDNFSTQYWENKKRNGER